ncbi:NADH-quinone oxidoreductase subunit I [Desulforhopalus vacuolatus]|uniref:NuoI/complex I 23 kDa subunit family protein n=1 Tax=Desulforhopalus vacuolatus TaxID=40414 RepID=UPI001962F554|nr:NADH-quinone oxidoreductase subunit I [Desulforhopalus vacuolatus]MBM9518671.1 NADH-quinone oxidoreductase subunit I [Desulforhopalus vacuolatus]
MINYFREIFSGLWSLFVGMKVTFIEAFSPKVTVSYPYETLKMCDAYRGHIELIENENGDPNCVCCMSCVRACPSGCISLTGEKPEGGKKKVLTSYNLDFTKCSLCSACVEACNFNAIEHSKEYNLASRNKEDFHFDLLARLRERNQ